MLKTTYDVEVSPREVREAWAQIQDGGMPFSSPPEAGSATARNLP
jgi:hypothetical protein